MFDTASGEQTKDFKQVEGWVKGVDISADGKIVICGSWDKTVKIFDLDTELPSKIFKGHLD